jgi:hypothetical protein
MTTETDAAASLRAVLAAIDADEIEATKRQRDYLAGAADALDRPTEETPPFPLAA